jgi:hypothetical protein
MGVSSVNKRLGRVLPVTHIYAGSLVHQNVHPPPLCPHIHLAHYLVQVWGLCYNGICYWVGVVSDLLRCWSMVCLTSVRTDVPNSLHLAIRSTTSGSVITWQPSLQRKVDALSIPTPRKLRRACSTPLRISPSFFSRSWYSRLSEYISRKR